MNTDDHKLHEKLRNMESIQARLEQHQKKTHLALMWISAIGIVLLALMIYIITRL